MANELTELGKDGPSDKSKKVDTGKLALIGIGFVTLVVTYLIYRRSQAASANAAQSVSGPIDPTTGLPYAGGAPAGNFGNAASPSDFGSVTTALNQLIASEGALSTQLTNLLSPPQGSSVTPSFTDVSREAQVGAGYNPPPNTAVGSPIVTSQGAYTWVPTIPILQNLISSGAPLYTQPLPGDFVPVSNPNTVTPGTAFYTSAPSSAPPQGVLPAGSGQTMHPFAA